MKKPLALLLIVAAALVVYAPATRDGFVWDDTALVQRDPLIRSWRLIPEGFNHFLFVDATASDFYRPIQRLSFTLDYAIAGFSPAVYHITSILIHAAAALVFFLFAEELLLAFTVPDPKRRWIALAAALVWVVHPVHTSAVVYISGRADPLAALFGLAGAWLILRGAQGSTVRLSYLLPAGLLFLLSGLSKESGLIFPLLTILLLALLKRGRAIWQTAAVTAFVGVVYASLRFAAVHDPAPVLHPPDALSLRPITMARAVAEYAGLIARPVNLHMEREINPPPGEFNAATMNLFAWRELQTLLGLALVAGAVYWMIRTRRSEPAVCALLLLAALSYLPMSGLLGLNAAVAEHWIYLPTAFLFLALATTLANRWTQLRPGLRSAACAVFAAWFLFLGARSCLRTLDWKDQRTFLQANMAAGGNSVRMLVNLGGLELSEGKLDLAKKHFDDALRREPGQPMAVMNRAVVALREDDLKLAQKLANYARDLPVVNAQALELLAILAQKEKGQIDLLRLRLAARTGPPNWAIEKRYVLVMAQAGATPAAVAELQMCLRKEWYRAESWQLLDQLLTSVGRNQEAAWARELAAAYDVHLAEHGRPL